MRDRLHRWRQKAHSAVKESPRVVAVVTIVLLLMTAGVAGQALQQNFSDDFEDGSVDGWRNVATDTDPEIREESYEGTYSLYVDSPMIPGEPDNPAMEWVSGPVINMNDDVNMTGTMRYDANVGEGTETVRVGLTGSDQEVEGENMYLLFDYGSGETRIGTDFDDTGGDAISNDFRDTWVRFRLASNENNGTLRAKVWEAGTGEPSDWQITRSGFEGESGQFGVNSGYSDSANRQIWLDSVDVEGSLATDPSLSLETRDLFQPGDTHEYTVREIRNESGRNESYDVTDNATVESLNTSLLTVNDNNTLTAVDDSNVSETVLVRAQYNDSTTYKEVVVAEPTVENLQIVPGIWRFFAVIDDSTMFALLIAALLSVPAARFTSAFGGLAVAEMVIVIGWVAGYIGFGFAAVSVFVALFIGLNLAANIDYQVRQ